MDSHVLLYPLADHALACRLERTEGRSNAGFVSARARAAPDSGATWIEVAGAMAMFDGVGSPVTQTFGLGLFDPVGPAELDRLEAFFRQRGADIFHEISPIADPALLPLLSSRGYQPVEFTSVMFQPIATAGAINDEDAAIRARAVRPGEEAVWAHTAASGWRDVAPDLFEYMEGLGPLFANRSDVHCFLAERAGEPIAAAAMWVSEGVALLAGASTLPAWRHQGAQQALLRERLRFAAGRGCDLAMMGAAPGSASQRNAERQGFRIAYTRIKWRLAATA